MPLWSERTAEADWRVRRGARARRPAVRVFDDGAVEVVVPERARAAFAPRLAALAAGLGCAYGRLQIRAQRTRWGSCSARGTISLNLCLLFQRPAVLQYLMLHELAHLRHMNHGHCEPRWREFDRELTRGWSQVPGWLLVARGARRTRAAEE